LSTNVRSPFVDLLEISEDGIHTLCLLARGLPQHIEPSARRTAFCSTQVQKYVFLSSTF
jgi:hypothetical protein